MTSLRNEIDILGQKIKEIEHKYEHYLDPKKYTILRVDIHGGSKYTRGLTKPYDERFANAMRMASTAWMKEFNGLVVYTESDEATLVLNHCITIDEGVEKVGELPYKGRIEKIISLSAGLFSSHFNANSPNKDKIAYCDCRAFQVDTIQDVYDVIYWRKLDGFRNGVFAIGQNVFSSKELHKKSIGDIINMIQTTFPDEFEKYKQSPLIHGCFIKKINIERPINVGPKQGELVMRTEIKYFVYGFDYKIEMPHIDWIMAKNTSEIELNNKITPTP